MSENPPGQPIHILSMPMLVGDVEATTRAMNLSRVLFEAPLAFAAGEAIEFSVFVALTGRAVRLDCRGVATACNARQDGRFDVEATIETFEIAPSRPAPQSALWPSRQDEPRR